MHISVNKYRCTNYIIVINDICVNTVWGIISEFYWRADLQAWELDEVKATLKTFYQQ
jgi:hypothetical protein